MSAIYALAIFAAGYCFRWVTQHLLHRITMRSQRAQGLDFDEARFREEGNYLLPKMQNPPPPPTRKTDATTRMSAVLSAATTIDWSQYADSTTILSLDGGQTWIIRDKSGKFASVTIGGLPKMPTKKDASND